ncbi:MAG TPA: hypothetical protein VJU15_14135 [Gemmatimonadales bacterium]|nr:hypothetical protein [Gemmatimonadales bacterium]
MRPSFLSFVATLAVASTAVAQSPPNACGLVAKPDIDRLITRGKHIYNAQPEAVVTGKGKGSLCLHAGGEVGIYVGPNAMAALEGTLKMLGIDKVPRQPVSGIGDKAWLFISPPIKVDNDHEGPYLISTVGDYAVTVFLVAYEGAADGPAGIYCRDSLKLKNSEKASCRKTLADVSEVPESLRPMAEELGKIVVAKVRSGKF